MDSTRYLVVGAGLAGAATAWRLAQRGLSVTLVDRDVPASAQGSSHGSARILRFAYPELEYVRLVQAALPGWRELEAAHGAPLLIATHALDFGSRRDPRGLAAVLERAGLPHELVPQTDAADRWPGLAPETEVLVHDGAVIDAQGTVTAMVAAAVAAGAQVHTGWPLARLERTGGGFIAMATDGRTLEAGHVVVAAGGWLPDLLDRLALPAGFRAAFPALQVKQENAFHFPYRSPAGQPWPTIIHKRADISIYSLPGGRDAGHCGQKIAEFNAGPSIGSAARQTGVIDPANRDRVTEYVRRYLPGLVPEPYAETTCLFTNTPGEDFVIDTADGVTVLSPCSGHGAKFAPVLGELAADAATGAGPVPDRFRVRSVVGHA